MAEFAVVGFYLSLNALWLVWLSAKVVRVRQGNQISIGDGDNKQLAHIIRAHGNATENIPIFFLLMGAAAALETPLFVLHLFGIALTLGRLLHGYWFLNPSKNLTMRVAGMSLTYFAIAGLAIGLLVHTGFIMIGGT